MLATSSAAGGLKMTVHGLVYDMTAKAAKEAALGAGGILHFVTAGRLRRTDIAKIKEINPNLILIAGGVDYGERDTALDNAEMIRAMGLKTPVIYAGNVENQEEMKLIFDEESGMKLYNVENVYPKIDALNVEPCRKVIQDAFKDHITNAPGMEHVRDMLNGPIIPKRTVEGDLGVYVNRMKVIESIGEEKLREECQKVGIDLDKTLESYVAIPKNEDEIKLVEMLTTEAVLRAVERHAGQIRYIYGPSGRSTVAEGKDLTQVKYIIGTGGALTRLPHRVEIMQKIAKHNETGMLLFPSEHAEILVDNDYIMASLGVLSKKHREGAIKLLEKSLNFDFSTVKKEESYQTKYIDEVKKLAEEAKAKEEETRKHIEEMEKAGYDMEAYKNPDDIGGANANGARADEIKKIIEEAERDGKLVDEVKKNSLMTEKI